MFILSLGDDFTCSGRSHVLALLLVSGEDAEKKCSLSHHICGILVLVWTRSCSIVLCRCRSYWRKRWTTKDLFNHFLFWLYSGNINGLAWLVKRDSFDRGRLGPSTSLVLNLLQSLVQATQFALWIVQALVHTRALAASHIQFSVSELVAVFGHCRIVFVLILKINQPFGAIRLHVRILLDNHCGIDSKLLTQLC